MIGFSQKKGVSLLNLKDIVYFNHLAKSLSFTETAEHFYISQPSISMALKRLESELETVLIDRKRIHKKLRLTETGEILLRHSNQILKSVADVQEEIHDFKNQIVYFGFLPTIGGHFMSQLMPHLTKFGASMKFVEEESSDTMLHLVQSGRVPLAIIGSDVPSFQDERLIQIPLKKEEMALWVARDNPLAKKIMVSATDIQDEFFISLEKGYTHQRIFEKWTQVHHINEPQTLYTKEIQTALSIASSTNMIAFMSDILIKNRTQLAKIGIEQAPHIYISLIVNKQLHDAQLFQAEFNQTIMDLCQSFGVPFDKSK